MKRCGQNRIRRYEESWHSGNKRNKNLLIKGHGAMILSCETNH